MAEYEQLKRSIVLGGHKTSVSLEDAFWEGVREIAKAQDICSARDDYVCSSP
jgi:predicted DNA-binding ribbon-helix-helix protein